MTSTDTPAVKARVETTWADLEVDGQTETIRADSEEEVRHEVLRRTMEIAVQTGEDTHLTATDSDGEWHLIVSPDGGISETEVSHASSNAPDGAVGAGQSESDVVASAPTSATSTADPTALSTAASKPDPVGDDLAANLLPFYIAPPPSVPTIGEAPDVTAVDEAGEDDAGAAPVDDAIQEDTVVRVPAPSWTAAPEAASAPEAVVPGPTPVDAPKTVTSFLLEPPVAALPTPAAPAPADAARLDTAPAVPAPMPTLADFRATQPPAEQGPASRGWRGALSRSTGGVITLPPSAAELRHREYVAAVTRSLSGPKTICVVNPKGGAHKTTAAMLIAATFGLHRGGYTLAWDNNETRGTLGWRAQQSGHGKTAVDLLADLDRFADVRSATVGDLDGYVRSQADAQFDVLASDEDAAASSMIDGDAFWRLHQTLQRFYRIIVVDTGNNMRASNWEAAVEAADQLVVVSAVREDTAAGAAWMVEGLAKKGHEAKLRNAVTILSAPDKNVDPRLRTRLFDHFGSLTRAVVEVPYDTSLVSGSGIGIDRLAPATREAWLGATATIADGL